MSSAEEMICKFTLKEINQIKKLCEPLQRHFGISFFYLSHTTSEGGFYSIGNEPRVQEHYYSHNLHKASPFFHNSSFIQPGIYSYRCIPDPRFQESLDYLTDAVGVDLGVCLVEKRGKELLRFGYSTNLFNGHEFLVNIINNLSILKEFNEYFLDKVQHIVKSNSSYLVNLPSELGVDYNRSPQGLKKIITCYDKTKFLDELGIVNQKKIDKLSRQQMACLEHLRKGLSCREIGDVLGIEPKTVESYMMNIKQKLDCDTKRELIHIAELLYICGNFDLA